MSRSKKFHRTKRGRKQDSRPQRYRILIITEGEKTEPNYFNDLAKDLPHSLINLLTIKVEGIGQGANAIIREAKKTIQNKRPVIFDEVWLVFDKDQIPNNDFNSIIINAQKENLQTAWSNEAFELWYLLHFNYYDTALNRNQYKSKIEREVKNKGVRDFVYTKNMEGFYFLLKRIADENLAIKNAEKLCLQYTDNNYAFHNPCTTVYKLIKQIREKAKDLQSQTNI